MNNSSSAFHKYLDLLAKTNKKTKTNYTSVVFLNTETLKQEYKQTFKWVKILCPSPIISKFGMKTTSD